MPEVKRKKSIKEISPIDADAVVVTSIVACLALQTDGVCKSLGVFFGEKIGSNIGPISDACIRTDEATGRLNCSLAIERCEKCIAQFAALAG